MSPHRIKPKPIKPSSSEQIVKAAHNSGRLFVHMFEAPLEDIMQKAERPKESLRSFFAVLAGKKGSVYSNSYHDVKGQTCGHPALAATLLSKGKPVPLFVHQSQVGLLFDGQDVKPLFVNHADAYSKVSRDLLDVNGLPHDNEDDANLGTALAQAQIGSDFSDFIDEHGEKYIRLSLRNVAQERRQKALNALSILRDALQHADWDKIYPKDVYHGDRGMNEVLLSAHMAAIKGIIVSEKPVAHVLQEREAINDAYSNAVYEADKLRQWLYKNYPTYFPVGSLPIMSYNPDRCRDQLRVLTEERINKPKLPAKGVEVG